MSSGNDEEIDERRENQWALVGRRLSRPCKQWSFYVVLIGGILFIGYLAVWIEMGAFHWFVPTADRKTADLAPLRLAFSTAILAVGAPCVIQILLTANRMAVLVAVVLALLISTLAFQASYGPQDVFSVHMFGIVGLLVAVLAWWLANGEDDLFQDNPNPTAASGGDPMRSLPGGDSGVKV